uniref:ATP-binding cassette domain-containing protein n=1 Tax=Desulfatirhabdium butyrativorans TaxID=340467 RepID=A0A7C4RTW4_9BACT
MPIIRCRNLHYRYPEGDSPLFENLQFEIRSRGFHAIFGHSGTGKTTLARMIAGELNGFEGNLVIEGAKTVFYTHNMERLPGWADVGELLRTVTPTAARNDLDRLIETFGLQACLHSRFARLSLGQKNRVNLTRYLVQPFDILIMDESLANVDETTRSIILTEIKSIYPDRCFLYISHNMIEVSRYCREIVVIRSPQKQPQAVCLTGMDAMSTDVVGPSTALEQVLLEIAHAT